MLLQIQFKGAVETVNAVQQDNHQYCYFTSTGLGIIDTRHGNTIHTVVVMEQVVLRVIQTT